jgi:hypothetical protein
LKELNVTQKEVMFNKPSHELEEEVRDFLGEERLE